MMRRPKETPVKRAKHEEERYVKRPPGKPKHTWTKQIKEDLSKININPKDININPKDKELECLTSDRKEWRATIGCAMSIDGKHS